MPKTYRERMRTILTPDERRLMTKLSTPQKIQDYLDALPINFKQTHRSVREALKAGEVQCIEAAIVAAAALAYHGREPLLLDLRSKAHDDDHVIALFKERGRWGAISKTNHPILRWRDPIYKTPRELAMSYFHEYFLDDGEKTLIDFSGPFSMSRYALERWLTAPDDLWWLAEALDRARHEPFLPKGMTHRQLRLASESERKTTAAVEWHDKKGKRN